MWMVASKLFSEELIGYLAWSVVFAEGYTNFLT